MLTHPTNTSNENTLRDFLIKRHPKVLNWGESGREGIVHRLDRVTSGLLICALQENTFETLKNKFKSRDIQKNYVALINGELPFETGLINVPLGRSKQNRSKRSVVKNGRESITKYEVIDYSNELNISKIKLQLITGRNHQIRAHMEYMKTPVLNDELYGSLQHGEIPENAIALHSSFLNFEFEGKDFEFYVEPPDFFNQVLDV